jgi:hypothetical protein
MSTHEYFERGETEFLYRCKPDETLSFKGKQCSGGKKSKQRVTMMAGRNVDGP